MPLDGKSSEENPSFLEPGRLVNTALGITVGIAWNNAVREAVDDFAGKSIVESALYTAILITLTVFIMYFLLNGGNRLANAFGTSERSTARRSAGTHRPHG